MTQLALTTSNARRVVQAQKKRHNMDSSQIMMYFVAGAYAAGADSSA
jgi:hypothetical protein